MPGRPTWWSPTTRCWPSTPCTAAPRCPSTRRSSIDEAHELVARVTGAASAELSPAQVERVGKRALTYLDDEIALELLESADALRTALDETPLERVEDPDSAVRRAPSSAVRTAARAGGQRADDRDGQARARSSARPRPP